MNDNSYNYTSNEFNLFNTGTYPMPNITESPVESDFD